MGNDILRKKQLFAEMMANSMDDRVEKMAFSQEDLDDLYEKGEKEIFICAEDLHIPLEKREVYYLGVNKPTIVIDSDELVDFEALGIAIEDCLFDEEYSKLVFAAEDGISEEDDDIAGDDTCEEGQEEIQQFYDSVKEFFDDYREELMDIALEGDFEDCFDIESLDPDDYNSGEYDYETKAKAKLACKSALSDMISEIKSELVSDAKSYMEQSRDYYSDLKSSFDEFISDLSNAYDSYAASECGDEIEAYVMSKKKDFFSPVQSKYGYSKISDEEIEKIIVKAVDKRLVVRELIKECDFDYDDEYYCFDLSSACDTINTEVDDFVSELEDDLPQMIYKTYKTQFAQALDVLETKFDEIFAA